MPKSDGSIIIDTRINTQGFAKGAAGLKSQFGGLASAAGKLGVAIAAAFSVKEIIAFSKEAIDLGSDLQEVQNVVDVTFSTMSEKVNEFAKYAHKTAGLSETMAKRYVGTFGAMAKSFRFTEKDAFNMSTALTQLTGDVASFYNLTQDEAYTKLKSVFTGETESLKDLGVVMTQTALDDFALRKGLGKTTSKMTEQEKVALRYQFVLEQLSTASGDFLRTSDGWANQTRLLSLQFDQLKATLGQGLINVLTPAIKSLNVLLEKLQAVAEAFSDWTVALFGNAGGPGNTIGNTADSVGDLADNLQTAEKAAKKLLAPFDEITKLGTAQKSDTGASDSFAGLGDVTIGSDVKDNLSPALEGIAQKIAKLVAPLQEIDFAPLMKQVKALGPVFTRLGSLINNGLSWVWTDILVPLSQWAIEDFAPASVELFAAALDLLAEAAEPVQNGIKKIGEHLEPVFTWLGETAVDYLNNCKSAFVQLGDKLEEKGEAIEGALDNIGVIFSELWEIAEPILNDLYTEFEDVAGITFDTMLEDLGYVIDAVEDLTAALAAMLQGDWAAAWDKLEEYLESLSKSLQNWADWYNEMYKKDWFKAIVDGLGNWFMSGGSTNNWYGIGGTAGYALPSAQLPHLASGTVIPPNAPFMAVLGDQKHGTNIEAPLSTIQEAVALVMEEQMAGMMAGFEAVVRAIQEKDTTISLDGDVVGRSVNDYNRKMNIAKGGA